ncbi:unnamed protein product, partial [Ectocarpus sp. 4 AP-2014]
MSPAKPHASTAAQTTKASGSQTEPKLLASRRFAKTRVPPPTRFQHLANLELALRATYARPFACARACFSLSTLAFDTRPITPPVSSVRYDGCGRQGTNDPNQPKSPVYCGIFCPLVAVDMEQDDPHQ